MSNKKQTAVEFLEKKYYDNDYNIFQEDFEQAKEIEKEQIINAFNNGENKSAEIYYKENYEQ